MTREIQLTRGCVAIVDADDYDWLMQWKWLVSRDGYAVRGATISGRRKHLAMHRLILTRFSEDLIGLDVDHLSMDKLDNRRSNLRWATRRQNQANRGKPVSNKSGFKGVSWAKKTNKWVANIMVLRKQINLGYYDDIHAAVSAYENAANLYHGDFARTK